MPCCTFFILMAGKLALGSNLCLIHFLFFPWRWRQVQCCCPMQEWYISETFFMAVTGGRDAPICRFSCTSSGSPHDFLKASCGYRFKLLIPPAYIYIYIWTEFGGRVNLTFDEISKYGRMQCYSNESFKNVQMWPFLYYWRKYECFQCFQRSSHKRRNFKIIIASFKQTVVAINFTHESHHILICQFKELLLTTSRDWSWWQAGARTPSTCRPPARHVMSDAKNFGGVT